MFRFHYCQNNNTTLILVVKLHHYNILKELNMAKKALIIKGGWDGHEPDKVASRFGRMLEAEGFQIEIADNLEVLNNLEKIKALHLIVPVWTMGKISKEQVEVVSEAVGNGTGIVGCHGGMCDAFRENTLWQFITGGNWVAHPGNQIEYAIEFRNSTSGLIQGLNDFKIKSEQYYLHVDPAVEVLATTRFPLANGYHRTNGPVDMPVVWTKRWGWGRVYYNSLGHSDSIFEQPTASELMRRGFIWAAEGYDQARKEKLSTETFKK
jgi:type 1 glutamine amidotransferase